MISLPQLETLTSAGLIRRAKKSLGKADLRWSDQSGPCWPFEFEGFSGTLNLPHPEQSTCGCPAAGLCKHIVAAAISSMEVPSSIEFVPPVFLEAELFAEAGKAASRFVYRHWQKRWQGCFDLSSDSVPVSLGQGDGHCILSYEKEKAIIGAGKNLTAITVESGTDRDKLLAALIYMSVQGLVFKWPDWLCMEVAEKQKCEENDRHERRLSVKQQLVVLVGRGVKSLKPANLIELTAMVPTLKSGGERRLANGILSLAEWVERRSAGEGLDPSENILQQLVSLYGQCESSREFVDSPTVAFDKLHLLCVGGHKWQAVSGAVGLTMMFLADDGQMFSASLMRGQKGGGFSSEQAWVNQNLWSGAPMNHDFVGKYTELSNVSVNRWHSLSLSQKTVVEPHSKPPFTWQAIADWQKLKSVQEYGYALLKVARWIHCDFDEVTQDLVLQLEDEHQQILVIRQAYSSTTENRIANLFDMWNQKGEYLVVRYVPSGRGHQFEPLSVYTKEWISLDFKSAKKSRIGLLQRVIARFKKSEHHDLPEEDELTLLLQAAENELSEYPFCDENRLNVIEERFSLLGLSSLQEKFALISSEPEQFLQLIYLIGALNRLNAEWPIYKPVET